MLYMNDSDMMQAEQRARTPGMRRACQFLITFTLEVNQCSDGWAYWKPPVRAAARLMKLIKQNGDISESEFKWALIPIKSFYTKRGDIAGMKFPKLEVW
jgi:hypothetical protein